MPNAHDSWAEVYDEVSRRSFGEPLDAVTARTIDIVNRIVPAGGHILDLGAGTGRLALPLAQRGYRVTAVDPSAKMLTVLRHKAEQLGIGTIRTVTARCQDLPVSLRCGEYDLALLVFSVVSYVISDHELRQTAAAVGGALADWGDLLIDVPGMELFRSASYRQDGLERSVSIEPRPDGTFDYVEATRVCIGDVDRAYEDRFRLRCWRPDEVLTMFGTDGFTLKADRTDEFAASGATYLHMTSSRCAHRTIIDYVRRISEANNIGWPERGSADETRFCGLIISAGLNGTVAKQEFDALLPPERTPSQHIEFAKSIMSMLDVFVEPIRDS